MQLVLDLCYTLPGFTAHYLPHIFNLSASHSPFIQLPPSQIQNSLKVLIFSSPGPSRTGKRQHVILAQTTRACWWLADHQEGQTKRQFSVSFPLCKDSNLACLSIPMPPVFTDCVGISCLWDLYLQSHPKWAEGSPKFSRGKLAERCRDS